MLKNYIKIAWRNIIRNKGYSLISTAGLAVGVACCILVGLYVYHEYTYESHHKKAKQIYRVGRVLNFGETTTNAPTSPYLLGEFAAEQLPEVENAVRITPLMNPLVTAGEVSAYEAGFYYAEPSLFEIFTIPFITGNPSTALSSPGSIVISEFVAEKYFASENPIGQEIQVNKNIYLTVTGVIENPPSHTDLPFHFLASSNDTRKTWNPITGNRNFLLLDEQADLPLLEESLMELTKANSDPTMVKSYFLERLDRIHLHSRVGATGDIRYVYIFSAVALFLLLIACINHINLSVAQLLPRSQEVGVRKVLGARQSQLSAQYLVESIVICLFVFVIALIMVEFAYPFINALDGVSLMDYSIMDPRLWGGLLLLGFGIACISVTYITFYLARQKPISIFKTRGNQESGNMLFRRGLITFQFVISITLICCTLIAQRQLRYIQETHLGYDKEHVLVLELKDPELREQYKILKAKLQSIAGVQSVSASYGVPVSGDFLNLYLGDDSLLPEIYAGIVDEDFIRVMGISVVTGETTDLKEGDIILNRKAADALGSGLEVGESVVLREGLSGKLAAVVENFHFQSLHEEIHPLFLQVGSGGFSHLSVKIDSDNIYPTIDRIDLAWKQFAPGNPKVSKFLDDQVEAIYRADRQFAGIFRSFSLITIVISCMGLFALSALAAKRRAKEVGIRKIMGASTTSIVSLLNKDFLKLVTLGFLIAIPITWYTMNRWLIDFAYRIEIGPGVFALAGLMALLIALVTVSWQSLKVALVNPVDSLRSE